MDEAQRAADFKTRGNEALKEGQIDLAIALFSMGLELQPENEVLWSNRSAAYCRLRKYERAVEDADSVLRLKPGWARGHSRKAAALEGMKRFAEALPLYSAALRIEPDNQAVKDSIERLTMVLEEVREEERRQNEWSVKKAKELHEDANRAKKGGDLERAVTLYGEAIALQTDGTTLAALYANRAACRVLLKEPREALQDATKAVEFRPDWGRGHSRRGAALWALGRLREARAAYIEALTFDSTNGELQAQIQRLQGEIEVAAKREKEGDTPEVRALECKERGNQLLKAGKVEEAERAYSEGLEHHPTQYVLFSNRAAARQRLGRLDDALQDAERCVELAPEWVKGHVRKAVIIKDLAKGNPKRLQGAVKAYLKAVELDPENVEWHDRAIEIERTIQEAERRRREAEENVLGREMMVVDDRSKQEVVVAADPEEEGDRKFELGDMPGAIGWYTRAIKKTPQNHKLYLKRGICWDKVRRYLKAIADFEKVGELDENNLQALWHCGNVYIRLAGQVQETDPAAANEYFTKSVLVFENGAVLDKNNDSNLGFHGALLHAQNERAAFDLVKDDRAALLARTRARAERRSRDGPGLDWKSMSGEEKKRRQADMKRKREDMHFDQFLTKQASKGRLKEVGIAPAKKREKYHTSVAAKHTYTADGP
eukprot:TRINITY_DN28874_c0_g1_i1.p1 TRINITY_DN28874_c0_g1~~TRINITY_DN28874_c0_g1_i1.p1  ORF type:complete len:680 (+),score=266.67 TRINITY_DN28874_c0_g1_i1:65-2041(+)